MTEFDAYFCLSIAMFLTALLLVVNFRKATDPADLRHIRHDHDVGEPVPYRTTFQANHQAMPEPVVLRPLLVIANKTYRVMTNHTT